VSSEQLYGIVRISDGKYVSGIILSRPTNKLAYGVKPQEFKKKQDAEKFVKAMTSDMKDHKIVRIES
jgi:hypothetical protein